MCRVQHMALLLTLWFAVYCAVLFRYMFTTRPLELKLQHRELKKHKHRRWTYDKIIRLWNTTRCEPLDPKILLYNRIFKTGSTSMTFVLDSVKKNMNFSMEFATTEDWYQKPHKKHVYPFLITRHAVHTLSRKGISRFAFIAHFYFRSKLKLPFSHTYINQVRDPVKRVISHYFYMHRSKERPKRRIREMKKSGLIHETLEECLEQQHKGCEHNVMTRFFCGKHSFCRSGNDKAVRRAKYNIKHYYASVGLLEHFGVFLKILHKRLPGFFPVVDSWEAKKVNHWYQETEISRRMIRAIRKANAADVRLYDYITKRFWAQAAACGIKE